VFGFQTARRGFILLPIIPTRVLEYEKHPNEITAGVLFVWIIKKLS
jgi:hypothetical protein